MEADCFILDVKTILILGFKFTFSYYVCIYDDM